MRRSGPGTVKRLDVAPVRSTSPLRVAEPPGGRPTSCSRAAPRTRCTVPSAQVPGASADRCQRRDWQRWAPRPKGPILSWWPPGGSLVGQPGAVSPGRAASCQRAERSSTLGRPSRSFSRRCTRLGAGPPGLRSPAGAAIRAGRGLPRASGPAGRAGPRPGVPDQTVARPSTLPPSLRAASPNTVLGSACRDSPSRTLLAGSGQISTRVVDCPSVRCGSSWRAIWAGRAASGCVTAASGQGR